MSVARVTASVALCGARAERGNLINFGFLPAEDTLIIDE